MAITNEALHEQNKALRELIEAWREENLRDHEKICDQLVTMNGRQRDNTASIRDNQESISVMRTRYNQLEADLKRNATIKSLATWVVSSVQTILATIFSQPIP